MGTNSEIFNIIKSMSMNEKRAFKIFCKKHTLGVQNKYILLFDTVDNCSSFNEKMIKETLDDKNYFKNYQ